MNSLFCLSWTIASSLGRTTEGEVRCELKSVMNGRKCSDKGLAEGLF